MFFTVNVCGNVYVYVWTYIVGVVGKWLVWYCGFRECQ